MKVRASAVLIMSLDTNNSSCYEQAALLLYENFECWSHIDEAKKKIDEIGIDWKQHTSQA